MLLARSVVVVTVMSSVPAFAGAPCLPRALFPKGADVPKLDLGLVAGAPVLCAYDEPKPGVIGCWGVDSTTGALSVVSTTALPGHGLLGAVDAKGCIDGYCLLPKPDVGQVLRHATSTDGAHEVVLRDGALHVFDAKTKKAVKRIELSDNGAPEDGSLMAPPSELFYVGNTIYVRGSDLFYEPLWSFQDDGKRTALIKREPADALGFSVFGGGVNVLDDKRVVLADAGLQHLLVVAAADGARAMTTRPVKPGPCKPQDLALLADAPETGKGCRKILNRSFMPFVGLDPILLPSGDYFAALGGKNRGSVAILDGKQLTEKKRIKLKVCPK